MITPYKIPPNNTNKRRQKILNANLDDDSHRKDDVKRPRLTSFEIKTTTQKILQESSPIIETVKPKKNYLECSGSIENNDEYLDEIFHNNNY